VNVELVDFEYDEFGNKIAAVVRFSGQPKDAQHGLLWVIKVEYDPETPEDAHRAAPDMLQYIAMGNARY
jgi:hypothetical protein